MTQETHALVRQPDEKTSKIYVIYENLGYDGCYATRFFKSAKAAYQKFRELKEKEYSDWYTIRRRLGYKDKWLPESLRETRKGEKAPDEWLLRPEKLEP